MIKFNAITNMCRKKRIKSSKVKKGKISIPLDKYLFIDLNMTLIDKLYQITDARIFDAIEELQHSGWRIGLNSNTPFEPLMVWKQYFKMNGPLVAEKGAVVFDNGQLTFDKIIAKRIQSAREAIEGNLKARKIQWIPGNPVDVIRENRFKEFHPGLVVLLNTVRKCSLNFYVRDVTLDGQAKINPKLTSEVIESLRGFYRDIDYLEEKISLENGLLLVSPKAQTKKSGTTIYMENKGLKQVGIIGDSINDYVGGDIAIHYAVNNAKQKFKNNVVFVSEFPLTKGCTDILERLIKQR